MEKVDLKINPVAYFDDDRVDSPGFYLLEGEQEEDENGVKHDTGMYPGQQVFPAPDGEGFTTVQVEVDEGGDD